MNFPQITIPDPAAVGKWLDEQVKVQYPIKPLYGIAGWTALFYPRGQFDSEVSHGDTPDELLADIKEKLIARDPLAKLRKEAEQHGYALMKLPED